MIRSLFFAAFAVSTLIEAASVVSTSRVKRDDRVEAYCAKHAGHYRKFCNMQAADLDRETFFKLTQFCPAFEKHCAKALASPPSVPDEDMGNMIVPPPLPKGNDFAALDLPIGHQHKTKTPAPQDATRLTAAIIASCTPDCNAPQCTDECKCANTHPRVHAMCNPPASAELAATCQRWYAKCPMFQPVQYY